jgi:hypothetical protein
MPFTHPIPFLDAIRLQAGKQFFPTNLSSEELMRLPAVFREISLFSARTANAQHLQMISDVIDAILEPQQVARERIPGIPTTTEGMSLAEGRLALQQSLEAISYRPHPALARTIQDLSSDQRTRLIIETNVRMAHGYGQWTQGQDEALLTVWPARELYRAEDRKEPRDWPARWAEAGGEFYEGASDYPQGRMIALADDPIWFAISAFGLPYPPFDFNSGMDVRNVTYREAVDLGVMDKDEKAEPQQRPFAETIEAGVTNLGEKLRKQLLRDVGKDFTYRQGKIKMKNRCRGLVGVAMFNASECGANAPGGGGFQPGNTCGGEGDGGGGGGETSDESSDEVRKTKEAVPGISENVYSVARAHGLKAVDVLPDAEYDRKVPAGRAGYRSEAFFDENESRIYVREGAKNKTELVHHEFGHALDPIRDQKFAVSESQEWLKASGWKETKRGYTLKSTIYERPVSDYGRKAPWEDFAETFRVVSTGSKFDVRVMEGESPARLAFMRQFLDSKGIKHG